MSSSSKRVMRSNSDGKLKYILHGPPPHMLMIDNNNNNTDYVPTTTSDIMTPILHPSIRFDPIPSPPPFPRSDGRSATTKYYDGDYEKNEHRQTINWFDILIKRRWFIGFGAISLVVIVLTFAFWFNPDSIHRWWNSMAAGITIELLIYPLILFGYGVYIQQCSLTNNNLHYILLPYFCCFSNILLTMIFRYTLLINDDVAVGMYMVIIYAVQALILFSSILCWSYHSCFFCANPFMNNCCEIVTGIDRTTIRSI